MRKNQLHLWLCAVLLCGATAGCESLTGRHAARDFDELIPRLMGAVKDKTPVEAAASLFDVTSPDERRDAVAYLQTKPYGHEPPYMKAYLVLATDPHPMVKAQTMRALGTSYKPDEAVPALLKGLNDADAQVRRDAAIGLGSTWNESAYVPLATHVKDDTDTLVRAYCAKALVHANTIEGIRALMDALGDQDAAVSKYAHDSLVALTGQSFGYDIRAWLTWFTQTYSAPATQSTRPG